jgi:hypothetical protein
MRISAGSHRRCARVAPSVFLARCRASAMPNRGSRQSSRGMAAAASRPGPLGEAIVSTPWLSGTISRDGAARTRTWNRRFWRPGIPEGIARWQAKSTPRSCQGNGKGNEPPWRCSPRSASKWRQWPTSSSGSRRVRLAVTPAFRPCVSDAVSVAVDGSGLRALPASWGGFWVDVIPRSRALSASRLRTAVGLRCPHGR